MDRLKAMAVFCSIADQGGLAGAARALGLSPPTVTRIINELEAYLGTQLLHRTTRSVTLTETGAAYLLEAQRLLEELQAAEDRARGAATIPTGTLRITASVLFGQHYIAPIMRDFVDRYPEVRVEALFVDRIVNLFDEGLDMAVRIGPLPDSNLRAVQVGAVRQVVCASPSYLATHGVPQHPDELRQHNIVAFEGLSPAGRWEFDQRLSVQLDPRISFTSVAPCIEAATAGWGITRVLSYQIGPQLERGELQPLLGEYATETWPIHLVHAEGRLRSAKVQRFMQLATTRLRANKFLS